MILPIDCGQLRLAAELEDDDSAKLAAHCRAATRARRPSRRRRCRRASRCTARRRARTSWSAHDAFCGRTTTASRPCRRAYALSCRRPIPGTRDCRRRQRAAVAGALVLHAPRFALIDRIPRDELRRRLLFALATVCFVRLRAVPSARYSSCDRGIRTRGRARSGSKFRAPGCTRAGLRTERHRIPVVRTDRTGRDHRRLTQVARFGNHCGPARLRIETGRPGHVHVVLRLR